MSHLEDKPLKGRRAAVMVGPLFEDIEALYRSRGPDDLPAFMRATIELAAHAPAVT